jgi:hypothetical protein
MKESKNSGLFYHGTSDEIQLGDRVRLKRWFRPDLPGVVCYIPGISPRHSDLEYEGVRQWAIRCDDGSVRPMGYDPESPYGQPTKSIVFIGRGSGTSLQPDEELL